MSDNKKWYLDALVDLNSSKISSEEHSLDVMSKIDDIIDLSETQDVNIEQIKTICFELIDMMQNHDLNKQKVERAMNMIIENNNVSSEDLDNLNIKNIASSAKQIDSSDGASISDEELEKLIASSK